MNTSEYLRTGDAVNITVTPSAYPFEVERDSSGRPTTNFILQGRVIYADALGVCLITNGGKIMPGFDLDRERLLMPRDGRNGHMFPWHSITGATLLARSAEYESDWNRYDAAGYVYADAHDDLLPESMTQYREWANTQDAADLNARIEAEIEASR